MKSLSHIILVKENLAHIPVSIHREDLLIATSVPKYPRHLPWLSWLCALENTHSTVFSLGFNALELLMYIITCNDIMYNSALLKNELKFHFRLEILSTVNYWLQIKIWRQNWFALMAWGKAVEWEWSEMEDLCFTALLI